MCDRIFDKQTNKLNEKIVGKKERKSTRNLDQSYERNLVLKATVFVLKSLRVHYFNYIETNLML